MTATDTARAAVKRARAIANRASNPELDRANAAADDWKKRCGFCEILLVGTMAEISAHRCPEYQATL